MNALKRFLRMNEAPPPTEVSKKEIINLALDKMGDSIGTWEWLRKLGIVQPPRPTYVLSVKVETGVNENPHTWKDSPRQVGYLLRRNKVVEVSDVQSLTPVHDERANDGAVPLAIFMAWAREVKTAHGYCSEFWDIVHDRLGVPKPVHEPVRVTFTLYPADFDAAEIEPGSDLDGDTIASVLREVDPQDLTVTLIES